MAAELVRELQLGLATSDAKARKAWATEMVRQGIHLRDILFLFHGEEKTAQRFMWFIGDLCQVDMEQVAETLPILFDLRDQVPFPGMHRSVSKWLLETGVPEEVEGVAVPQMLQWLADSRSCIASKSFSAKALANLVRDGRLEAAQLLPILEKESRHKNPAYASRIKKLINRIRE